MGHRAMRLDFFREIRHTLSRFFSILILSALAVAFLSGLRSTAPDMKNTGDAYLDRQGLMDLRVVSTLGFADSDLQQLLQQESIAAGEAVYTIDAYAGSNLTDITVKVHTLGESGINQPQLLQGRMPQADNELLAEDGLLSRLGLSLGDSVRLTPGDSYADSLRYEEFTVVGVIRSPYYIAAERGTSSIGNGHVACYVYLRKSAFCMDAYTELLLQVRGAAEKTAFTEDYDDFIDAAADQLDGLMELMAQARYDSIVGEAQGKLDDAAEELDQARRDAQQELSDAGRELQEGREELDQGWADYRSGQAELQQAYADLRQGEKELADGRQELADGEKTYEENLQKYQDGEQQYADGLASYQDGLNSWRDSRVQLQSQYSMLMAMGQTAMAQALYQQTEPALEQAERELDEARAQLEESRRELDEARTQLEEAGQELADGRATLQENEEKLDQGWADYRSGLQELKDAYAELQSGEKDYAEGLAEYRDGEQEANDKIAQAEKELSDAQEELSKVDDCQWYLFTRQNNPGYTGFGQDADRMGNLASTFPVIFFLVAALVCLTTMTRMVDEKRIEIGSLKALGYSKWAISWKYVGYGLFASVIGSVLGLFIGCTLLPSMIYTAYQIMYEMPDLQLRFYPEIGLTATVAAVLCTTGATLFACMSTLSATPATLMRPRTPKAGKRVLLEYIRPLWKRMGFIQKVTARNLFRYQKRFWMTVAGIGACTALIIAGFGLRASLLHSMDYQYDDLFHYDAQVILDSDSSQQEREQVAAYLQSEAGVTEYDACYLSSVTADGEKKSQTAYLNVIAPEKVGDYVTLRTRREHTPLTLGDDGVIITEKMSELLELQVGDSFMIDGPGRRTVTVAAITEHYVSHFIYMSPTYYRQVFGEPVEENGYLMRLSDGSEETCSRIFTQLLQYDSVLSTSRMADTRNTYQHSMERVDFVVVIIIFAAGALAFVVLFNLSNINISERIRELATIKLLGFYDREVSAYIYRENIVLTVLGIVLGLFFGHYLHLYLVHSTEIDLLMFGRDTAPSAYVWAALLTALFSLLVNVLAHFKMKKIDMVESLKAAE